MHTEIAGYGRDHRVRGCVTNCVTITTDDHGLSWILRGCLNWSNPRKCAGQGTVVIASDEEAVGSNPATRR
jgi:hypothetical protein